MDYGLDMLAVLWYARDTEGNAYVYKEIHEPNLIISEAAKKELNKSTMVKYEYIYAPEICGTEGKKQARVLLIYSLRMTYLTKTSVDRVDGWFATKEWLKVIDSKDIETGKPIKTKIFRNCNNLINPLPQGK